MAPAPDPEPPPSPERRPDSDGDAPPGGAARTPLSALGWDVGSPPSARERRLVTLVESFLRDVRAGGSLDPEPYLRRAPELRADLEPLLLAVLRLEASSERLHGHPRRQHGDPESQRGDPGSDPAGG